MKNTFLAKTFTIILTVPRAIALGIGSLVLISWFFFLGLIVGRGYEPEAIIPQVAQIMPQPGETAPFLPEGATPLTEKPTPLTHPGGTNGRSLIAEADKAYRANKKQEGTTASQSTPPSLTPPKQQPQTGAAAPQATTETADVAIYAYTYQLASFKEEKAAHTLRDKLKKAGFKPRINISKSSKSTWYRVLVDFNGTTAQAEAAKARLKKDFKLGEPLKLSQKKKD